MKCGAASGKSWFIASMPLPLCLTRQCREMMSQVTPAYGKKAERNGHQNLRCHSPVGFSTYQKVQKTLRRTDVAGGCGEAELANDRLYEGNSLDPIAVTDVNEPVSFLNRYGLDAIFESDVGLATASAIIFLARSAARIGRGPLRKAMPKRGVPITARRPIRPPHRMPP